MVADVKSKISDVLNTSKETVKSVRGIVKNGTDEAREFVESQASLMDSVNTIHLMIAFLLAMPPLMYSIGIVSGALGMNCANVLSFGVLLFLLLFILPMLMSALLVSLGLPIRRLGCDLLRDLGQPALKPLFASIGRRLPQLVRT